MREVLFRGKRIDNGMWVRGDLTKSFDNEVFINYIDSDNHIRCFEVIPKTVGEYTGLPDKHGKKIFEGDICTDGKNVLKIIWNEERHGFYCKVINTEYSFKKLLFPLWQWDNYTENRYRRLDVIGNIHDDRLEGFNGSERFSKGTRRQQGNKGKNI